ncbi:MAG: hypothetical protein V1742_03495 [Pseudomonadota bacterium]
MTDSLQELLDSWPEAQSQTREAFLYLVREAEARPESSLSLVSRPGVSFSFRAETDNPAPDRDRPVYFLVDVIMSEAEPWFLSACFYENEITDPEELGNPIPQGLFNDTGYCFDVEDKDPHLLAYLKERLAEAHASASGKRI